MLRFDYEWIASNQNGSFSMGAIDRLPRRKYHSLLTQRTPLKGEPLNWILEILESINGEAIVNFNFGKEAVNSEKNYLKSFSWNAGLEWVYQVGPIRVTRKLSILPKSDIIQLDYEFSGIAGDPVVFEIRPLMLVRPWHQLTVENIFFNGAVEKKETYWQMTPYKGLGQFNFYSSQSESVQMVEQGTWFKNIFYQTEEERGYPCSEDAFVPAVWIFRITKNQKISFSMGTVTASTDMKNEEDHYSPALLKKSSNTYLKALYQSAESYIVKEKAGFTSIIAGYPWFESWGRDTMLALPGLLLATGKLKLATQLLNHWKDFFFLHVPSTARGEISESQKSGEQLNLTGKDTPLLFIRALRLLSEELSVGQKKELLTQIQPGLSLLIRDYIHGNVPGIKICTEGFWVEPGPFAAGWMDAIIDGVPVTPRHGFAVDLCALWIDSLSFAIRVEENPTLKCNLKDNSQISATELDDWKSLLNQNRSSFKKLFWSKESGYLASNSQ
jgi:predicted glycogen debranching enzyme